MKSTDCAINSQCQSTAGSKFAKVAFGLIGAGALGLTAVALPFVTPALRRHCLPFIPATDAQVENVVRALRFCSQKGSPMKRVVDLGSGDGRIADLSKFDAVVIFGTESLMSDLSKKFASELKQDSFVVACRFEIPHWCPLLTMGSGMDAVWIYSMNQSRRFDVSQ